MLLNKQNPTSSHPTTLLFHPFHLILVFHLMYLCISSSLQIQIDDAFLFFPMADNICYHHPFVVVATTWKRDTGRRYYFPEKRPWRSFISSPLDHQQHAGTSLSALPLPPYVRHLHPLTSVPNSGHPFLSQIPSIPKPTKKTQSEKSKLHNHGFKDLSSKIRDSR